MSAGRLVVRGQRDVGPQGEDAVVLQSPCFPHSQFPTPEAVLEGARYMVALQIAREPLVRQVLRQTFQERAKLNITPTKKGRKVSWGKGFDPACGPSLYSTELTFLLSCSVEPSSSQLRRGLFPQGPAQPVSKLTIPLDVHRMWMRPTTHTPSST